MNNLIFLRDTKFNRIRCRVNYLLYKIHPVLVRNYLFILEKVSVKSKSRPLNMEYTVQTDLVAEHLYGLDAYEEIEEMLKKEKENNERLEK